jgi:PAS domain S-box-containing protein
MPDRNLLAQENAALKRQLVERSRSLADAEARYDAVFNSALNLMALCTVDGIVLDVNRTAIQAIGIGIEGFVGKHLWETPWFARNPEEAAKVEAAVTAHRGKYVEYESRVFTRRKDWRLFQFILRPFSSQLGGEARFLVFEGREVASARVENAPTSVTESASF